LSIFIKAALPEPTFGGCAVGFTQDAGLFFNVALNNVSPDGDDTSNELETV